MISDQEDEQVTSFKLLGATVTDSLRWNNHIDAQPRHLSVCGFLKNSSELVYHRPISSTTMKQLSDLSWSMPAQFGTQVLLLNSKALDAVQRRACQIIFGGGSYSENCCVLNMDSLHTRCQQQTRTLFDEIVKKPEHCPH